MTFRSLAEHFHANDAAQRECTSLQTRQRSLLDLRMQRFGSNNVRFSLGCRFVFAAAASASLRPLMLLPLPRLLDNYT